MNSEPSQARQTALIPRLLVGLVKLVTRYPAQVLLLAGILCVLAIQHTCAHLEYRTQRSDLMSPQKDYQQRWHKYLAEFGNDDDIVVVVQGKERHRLEQALEAVAEQVENRPQLFDRLFFKVDLRGLRNRALLFRSTEEIQSIQENLKSMTLLLEFGPIGWRSLNLLGLVREARHRASQIVPHEQLSPANEEFLGQFLAIIRSATDTLAKPTHYRNPWSSLLAQQAKQKDLLAEPQYFFSDDGSLAILLVRPVKDESSFTSCRGAVAELRQIVTAVQTHFSELEFGLTGLPVLETDEMVASQQDSTTASWLALAGMALLYLVVYRSLRYPLLTVATLLVGIAWAMGWLTLTVGHLNILSVTFAVMLIGMGDYGVLWVARYEQERLGGFEVQDALLRTAASVGPGILTAAATTAMAFYAAMLADFQAIAELGWIAGSGILLCALSCFTVLPAFLCLSPCFRDAPAGVHQVEPETQEPIFLTFPRPVRVFRHWILGGSLAVTLVLGVLGLRVGYDHNLLRLQAQNLDSVKWELTLIQRMAGTGWHALSYTSSPEAALALKKRYEQLPEVSRVAEVASLLPAEQDRKRELLRDIQHRLRNLPDRGALIPHVRPSLKQLKAELTCLLGQLQPLADASPEPLLAHLRRSLMEMSGQLEWVANAESAETSLRNFEEKMSRDLADDLHRLRDVSSPGSITVADLPAALRERFIGANGKWLLRVFAKDCLWDYEPMQQFVDRVRTIDPEATGKPFGTLEGLRSMKYGFLWAGIYALIAIVGVLAVDFRKPGHVLLALAPLAMGLIFSLGLMGIIGLSLNPANMIALPLILGVGVDNGVHVLHDYLSRRGEGVYRLHPSIGRGILVAALTTIIGFGTLIIATHRGLASLGLVLTLGVTCCMVAALVFLPALLQTLSAGKMAETKSEPVREQAFRRRVA